MTELATLATRVAPFRWHGDWQTGQLDMLDQRELPARELWLPMRTAEDVARGIREMATRGAPAIGIAAAWGVALGMRALVAELGPHVSLATLGERIAPIIAMLAATRPTAVNLFWALDRVRRHIEGFQGTPQALVESLFAEAQAIDREDRENNLKMGMLGAALLPKGARVLTHCNTGGLATGGYGTALGIIRAAHGQGRLAHVWVDETRPYLQGARLTAWECMQEGIPATLITDNMAAYYMQQGEVDAVIVGTDRVAANGDVANKIGTYGLAVLCQYHKIPFYVAAPLSTIDLGTASGQNIPIEQRSAREVTHLGAHAIAPEGMPAAHPAFDVTPAALITAIITECGVARPAYPESLAALF